jgi:hypothetical protein
MYYKLDCEVSTISHEQDNDIYQTILKIDYKKDNPNNQSVSTANLSQKGRSRKSIVASNFEVRSELFFELFPFHIIFKKSRLEIISVGEVLGQAMKNIEGESLRDLFNIVRPMINEFTWEKVN